MTGPKDETCAPDLNRLAAAWIALWQGELAALATDPEVTAAWRQAFGLGAAWLRTAQAEPAPEAPPSAEPPIERAAGPPGAASAGAALGAGVGDPLGGADSARLRARIDELERRLAALEGGAAGGGADHRAPRRKRPRA